MGMASDSGCCLGELGIARGGVDDRAGVEERAWSNPSATGVGGSTSILGMTKNMGFPFVSTGIIISDLKRKDTVWQDAESRENKGDLDKGVGN